jgi:ribonuclease HI
MTWVRLNNYQTTPRSEALLPKHLKDIYEDFKKTGLAHCKLDTITKESNDLILDITISDGLSLENLDSEINIYTDGSKTDKVGEWGTGAGFVIRHHNQTIMGKWITLCHTKTVFMAEVIAITQSLRTLQDKVAEGIIPLGTTITIFTDSQSSLKALASPYVHSKTVKECLQMLKIITSTHPLKLAWVKAHVGIKEMNRRTNLQEWAQNSQDRSTASDHSIPCRSASSEKSAIKMPLMYGRTIGTTSKKPDKPKLSALE